MLIEPSSSFIKKWETWEKYSRYFRSKKYILSKKSIGKNHRIFLVNKEEFKKIVRQNIDLFRQIIKPNLSAETLLEDVESENTNILDIIDNNEGLLGILLGFGRHNAMLFNRREKILDKLDFPLNNPASIQRKIKNINKKLQPLHKHDPYIVSSLNRVCFCADPNHIETIRLKNKYDEINKKINEIYSKDDWFETTLLQLTSD